MALGLGLMAGSAMAENVPDAMAGAEVVFLGEIHDNPHHHKAQARYVSAIKPKALVLEMLTPAQVAAARDVARGDQAALAAAFDWKKSGWPDFAMYFEVLNAHPEAALYGAAVPRSETRKAMKMGVAQWFGTEDAARFGLNRPLDKDQQAAREEYQFKAHCDAMPKQMMAIMVDLQRLRDASLARATLRALNETGGPVAVITGNGHAREDWGAPVALLTARPGLRLFTLGQVEENHPPQGRFDLVISAPTVDRKDPCAAFRKKN